jgi:hypothetical protein
LKTVAVRVMQPLLQERVWVGVTCIRTESCGPPPIWVRVTCVVTDFTVTRVVTGLAGGGYWAEKAFPSEVSRLTTTYSPFE